MCLLSSTRLNIPVLSFWACPRYLPGHRTPPSTSHNLSRSIFSHLFRTHLPQHLQAIQKPLIKGLGKMVKKSRQFAAGAAPSGGWQGDARESYVRSKEFI
jgi:hypothetical protein